MIMFNDFIRSQSLIELPIKGRAYTWSNMQLDPLLEPRPRHDDPCLHTPCRLMVATPGAPPAALAADAPRMDAHHPHHRYLPARVRSRLFADRDHTKLPLFLKQGKYRKLSISFGSKKLIYLQSADKMQVSKQLHKELLQYKESMYSQKKKKGKSLSNLWCVDTM